MYPPQAQVKSQLQVQPSIEQQYVAKQPMAREGMSMNPGPTSSQQDPMRLRGGCPGKFCGLPILPCACDICIIPIPCC
ncbi:hypothetical protein M231_05430 [Tremella mesenterica]|uniref:Uncharacterized protein n=1 Tax=Tremella mesenterica TaxID=5217 RepID=A0A4Q1BI20_TREME|nr:hypothetical protein M231_05430 [Tremella mesenterica]